jgi:uncharacterized membrane protein
MFTHLVLWLWLAGLVFLAAGLAVIRRELFIARGLARWIELGPVFVAAPLAVFAAEHFVAAKALAQIVPAWMPARLFWAYFVGFALLAAALSLVARKFLTLSATLLGVMFLLIVCMIHLPNAIADPRNRIAWIVAFRETAFAGGAWAFAARQNSQAGKRAWMILFGRFSMAAAVIFFGVERHCSSTSGPASPPAPLVC